MEGSGSSVLVIVDDDIRSDVQWNLLMTLTVKQMKPW